MAFHPNAPIDNEDLSDTQILMNILTQYDVFDKVAVERKRNVLHHLELLGQEWIRAEAENRFTDVDDDFVPGKLLIFGSQSLCIYQRSSDIDAILVAPNFVKMRMFFDTFVPILADNSWVTSCLELPEARFPMVKLVVDGVDIDLLFVSLKTEMVPAHLELYETRFRLYQDEWDQPSMNGMRTSDAILRSITDVHSFHITLLLVKQWAKQNGIYSHAMGYLGGVSWAILVAKICQTFPLAVPSKLLEYFFVIFGTWPWQQPVQLGQEPIAGAQHIWSPEITCNLDEWSMPIMTPCHPSRNTTFNICKTSHQLIQNAFQRAIDLCDRIRRNEAVWADLFERFNFFESYNRFMVVHATAFDEDLFVGWRGLVASRLRLLALALEHRHWFIECAHLHPHMFDTSERGPLRVCWFIGIVVKQGPCVIDLRRTTQEFLGKLYNADARYRRESHQISVKLEIIGRARFPEYMDNLHEDQESSGVLSKVIDSVELSREENNDAEYFE